MVPSENQTPVCSFFIDESGFWVFSFQILTVFQIFLITLESFVVDKQLVKLLRDVKEFILQLISHICIVHHQAFRTICWFVKV
jgi:hypothetical protein